MLVGFQGVVEAIIVFHKSTMGQGLGVFASFYKVCALVNYIGPILLCIVFDEFEWATWLVTSDSRPFKVSITSESWHHPRP